MIWNLVGWKNVTRTFKIKWRHNSRDFCWHYYFIEKVKNFTLFLIKWSFCSQNKRTWPEVLIFDRNGYWKPFFNHLFYWKYSWYQKEDQTPNTECITQLNYVILKLVLKIKSNKKWVTTYVFAFWISSLKSASCLV